MPGPAISFLLQAVVPFCSWDGCLSFGFYFIVTASNRVMQRVVEGKL